MSLLHIIFEEGLESPGRLAEFTESFEGARRVVEDFSPQMVAPVTGINAEAIRGLARDFASAPSAVCYGRMGVSTQGFGGLCQWLVNLLNIVTGNLDRPGGAMFTKPAVDLVASTGRGHLGRRKSRVRGLPAFGGELPVAALAEEILSEGNGQIRALVTVAGNPVLSTPNGTQLEGALARLEFMAAIDFYLNETTRHAHIILPPTAALEHDHYDLVFNLLAVRNVARYSPAIFDAGHDTRHDWQVLSELDRRAKRGPVKVRFRGWLNAKLGPRRMLDLGLRSGPYGSGINVFGKGLTLKRLERQVHGVDLGPLEPCLPARLRTRDRRIEIAPTPFIDDVQRLQRFAGEFAGGERLLLIGRRDLRSNNSWMHNSRRLVKGRDRCTLLVHPTDADRLGVATEAKVEVVSRIGHLEVLLELSDEVMPGVVSLPHGWGHHRPDTRIAVAEQHPGASANDLTDDQAVDELSGNAVLNGVPVEVRKIEV